MRGILASHPLKTLAAACLLAPIAPAAWPAEDDIAYIYTFAGRYTKAQYGEQSLLDRMRSANLHYIFLKNKRFIYGVGQDDALFFLSGGEDDTTQELLVSTIDTVSTPGQEQQLLARAAQGKCDLKGDLESSVTVDCRGTDSDHDTPYHFVFVSRETMGSFSPGHEPADMAINVKYSMYLFDDIYRENGIEQVRQYVTQCYQSAARLEKLPPLVACGAIDYAGAFIEEWATDNQLTANEVPLTTRVAASRRLGDYVRALSKRNKVELGDLRVSQVVENTAGYTRLYLKEMMIKRAER